MSFLIPAHASPSAWVALGAPVGRTASDLIDDAGRLAEALKGAAPTGLEAPGTPGEILIICSDRYHFAVALLAVWRCGFIAALPPNGQPETVHALAAKPEIRALVHDTDASEGIDLRAVLAERAAVSGQAPVRLPPGRAVATLYTSGSTGEGHKRCPKTAAELFGEARAHIESFRIEPGERFAATVPGHHIYGLLWSVLVPLLSGGAFLRQTPFYPDAVAARAAEIGATHLVSVPAHLRGIALLDALPGIRRIVSSSAPLPKETARAIRDRFGIPVTEIYGSSETGGIAFRESPEDTWRPLAGVVAGSDGEGRLLLDSPFLSPDLPRPLPCDDRVEMQEDGTFALLGRLDGVLKIGGKRISLAEVERRLLCVEGVEDAACLAEAVDSGRGVEIWAAVVAPKRSTAELRAELRRWLDPVTVPRRIQRVAALPREENGKLRRARLKALFEPR